MHRDPSSAQRLSEEPKCDCQLVCLSKKAQSLFCKLIFYMFMPCFPKGPRVLCVSSHSVSHGLGMYTHTHTHTNTPTHTHTHPTTNTTHTHNQPHTTTLPIQHLELQRNMLNATRHPQDGSKYVGVRLHEPC